MLNNRLDNINQVIDKNINKVRKYFFNISQNDINFKVLIHRVNKEMPNRLVNLNDVIEATIKSDLKSIGRELTKKWKTENINKYYDSNIIDQIDFNINKQKFENYNDILIKKIWIGLLAISTIIFLIFRLKIFEILSMLFKNNIVSNFKVNFLLLLITLALISIISKFLLPKLLNSKIKNKVQNYLNDYLNQLGENYKKSAELIFNDFEKKVNTFGKTIGE
ncbi:hypothetical protein C0585_01850 [Candidatus Woesearchaeota archaeon]|nr:MAG: hypothetical protein C0585_01850 [Candidatus Woesearchaeota archaeon]